MSNDTDKIKVLLLNNLERESDISHILTLVRKELESLEKSSSQQYDFIKLFCDWALHKKIDRSEAGSTLITEIHNTIILSKTLPTDQIIKLISNALLRPLKNQLLLFLKNNSLQTDIITDDLKWRSFLKNLFAILLETPVNLKKLQDEADLQINPIKKGMWVKQILITTSNFCKKDNEIYCLEILTNDTTKIYIPLSPI